jgi:hydrogenase maturation protease
LRTLIFGYGNLDRQDDGVAWHILSTLKKSLNLPFPEVIDEDFDSIEDSLLVFQLQLTPEQAESIANFDRVCFIDAHTGAIPEDVRFDQIVPNFQHSPLTHHLTPNSLLSIIQTIYNKDIEAVLLSVRGYEFEFSQDLSERTKKLVPRAVKLIREWLDQSD